MSTEKTTISQTKENDLFLQIRTAHRLLAAYYQRLLPTIDDIAKALSLTYYGWLPDHFDRPCKFGTDIFSKWQWDLLPGNCTHYIYFDGSNANKIEKGHYLLEFFVISDSGIDTAMEEENRQQPDALNLPVPVEQATSVLRVGLYAPYRNRKANWYDDLYNQCDHPEWSETPDAQKVAGNVGCYISGFEIPLAELMENDAVESISKRINEYKQHLFDAVKGRG